MNMPELITSRLTFAVVTSILDRLMAEPSNLKREWVVLASLLSAEAEADELLHVEVSPAHAANPRAGTIGEVAIWRGGLLQEIFLVAPRETLPEAMVVRASHLLDQADLPRIHIVTETRSGATAAGAGLGMAMASGGHTGYQDVSVLDIRHEIRSVTARMPRQSRRSALHKLDLYLRALYADPDLADEYILSLYDTSPEIVREPCCHPASNCCLHDTMTMANGSMAT